MKRVPLTKPYVPLTSRKYAIDALSETHQQGDGNFGQRCTILLNDLSGRFTLLTPSCTAALELASSLIDIDAGDEVILPSFNFTSAALAIVNNRATPVFVDINPITKCIDVDCIEDAITSRTRAISWVNYGGCSPNLSKLTDLAEQYNLVLIEDNAHCLGNEFSGQQLGVTGDFVTYSFHATKNFQCGEGGAISIKHEEYIEAAQIMREKGTNRTKFMEGKVDKYTWVGRGSSHLLSEVQAAVLLGQLENYENIQYKRNQIIETYVGALKQSCERIGIQGSFHQIDSNFAAHLFYLEFEGRKERSDFINFMDSQRITTAFHYQSLHESEAGKRFGRTNGNMHNTERASEQLVRIPLYFEMTENEIELVVTSTLTYLNKR